MKNLFKTTTLAGILFSVILLSQTAMALPIIFAIDSCLGSATAFQSVSPDPTSDKRIAFELLSDNRFSIDCLDMSPRTIDIIYSTVIVTVHFNNGKFISATLRINPTCKARDLELTLLDNLPSNSLVMANKTIRIQAPGPKKVTEHFSIKNQTSHILRYSNFSPECGSTLDDRCEYIPAFSEGRFQVTHLQGTYHWGAVSYVSEASACFNVTVSDNSCTVSDIEFLVTKDGYSSFIIQPAPCEETISVVNNTDCTFSFVNFCTATGSVELSSYARDILPRSHTSFTVRYPREISSLMFNLLFTFNEGTLSVCSSIAGRGTVVSNGIIGTASGSNTFRVTKLDGRTIQFDIL